MTLNLKSLALTYAGPLEFKFDETATTFTMTGYASVFDDVPDAQGDVVARGAFTKSLIEHQAAGTMPVMLFSHDPSRPIGRWVDIREDAKGLVVEGRINLGVADGRDAAALVKAGDLTGLSIGYFVPRDGSTRLARGGRLLKAIDLMEISLVALPSNRRARIASKRDLEEMLQHKCGVSALAAKKIAAGGWKALSASQDVPSTQPYRDAADKIGALAAALRKKS